MPEMPDAADPTRAAEPDGADGAAEPDEADGAAEAAGRNAAIESIQRELTAFARRARTAAAQLHPDLSLVSYSMLDLMAERGGCRAADLAAHYMLDKSTVSRQVSALERMGLIVRESDPEDHRVQTLRLSAAGAAALEEANRTRRAAFEERFTDWDDQDILRFAEYVHRYNRGAHPAPRPSLD